MPAKNPTSTLNTTPVEKDWIAAARTMLIEGGVAAVQVNPLAARLGVTRGGFYWRFHNRNDLLEHLLDDWEDSNARTFLQVLERPGTPRERYDRLVTLWIEETDFDPKLEAAVRQWGRLEQAVKQRVRAVDLKRIETIAAVFIQDGRDAAEAHVRARIIYFHQVGYYALELGETLAEREKLAPLYTQLLTNFAPA